MIKNIFITALRNLKSNKGFSLLNIFGLSLGIFSAILIGLWIDSELSYDRFHANYKNAYQLLENQSYDNQTYTFPAQPGPLAPALVKELPEIKYAARASWGESHLFSKGDKALNETGYFVDASFLKIFSFPLLKGNAATLFNDPNSVVISREMAEKFFSSVDEAFGKTLRVDNQMDFKISGILENIPQNSTLKFSCLIPFSLYEKKNAWLKIWDANSIQTFVELQPNTNPIQLNKKLYSFIQKKNSNAKARPFLFSMSDWRLHYNFEQGKQSGGRIEYIKLFGLIAIIIIVIACINFMNLATARSEKRMREIGVRKVLGAEKKTLVLQFLGEALAMAFAATLLACVLTQLLLPAFNRLIEQQLQFHVFDPLIFFSVFAVAVLCGLLAGSYPAFYLSSFKPVYAFKGVHAGKNTVPGTIRKTLVVTQFIAGIILIISTSVVSKQISYIKNRHLGYEKDNLIYMDLNGDMAAHKPGIQNDLLASGVTNGSCGSANLVINQGSATDDVSWKGKDPSQKLLITLDYIDPDYVSTIGLKIKEGRDFYKDAVTDSMSILVNEAFANLLHKKTVEGSIIQINGSGMRIAGVVNDFLYNDLYNQAQPMVFFCMPKNEATFYIRLKNNRDVSESLKTIETVLKKHDPMHPFSYKFLNEFYDAKFKSETLVGNLSRLFAGMAIFISCLGLFGLSAYIAERRTREIGIRKVLGAQVFGILRLLSVDFIRLVLIASLIAFPLAWLIMNKWLQSYAYHTAISWWIFLLAGCSAIAICLLTISLQSIKAAISNPVKSLRTE